MGDLKKKEEEIENLVVKVIEKQVMQLSVRIADILNGVSSSIAEANKEVLQEQLNIFAHDLAMKQQGLVVNPNGWLLLRASRV